MDVRIVRLSVVLSAVVLAAACAEPGAATDAADRGQGSETSAVLVVNEVSPKPASGADWLELLNRSGEAIDLCGYFVTDDLERLDHYLPLGGVAPPDPCPPRWLQPGEYLLVYADDAAAAGLDHAPFKLGVADEAHVVTITGEPVDSLRYLFPTGYGSVSLGRVADGSGRFYPVEPTPGAANPQEAL